MSQAILDVVNDTFTKELACLELSDAEPSDLYPVYLFN